MYEGFNLRSVEDFQKDFGGRLDECSLEASNRRLERSKFDSDSVPNLSLSEYLDRLVRYMKLELTHLRFAAHYLDKFVARNNTRLCCSNVHRLVAAACLISVKFLEDVTHTNTYYSCVVGLELRELNLLEIEFLSGLNFELWSGAETALTHPLRLQKD